MRPPMLIALTLAMALTAWVALQDDEGTVEPVRQGANAERRGGGGAPAKRPAKADEDQAQRLVASVAQWQSRQPLPPLTPDTAMPWGSQRPPPPPPPEVVSVAPPPPMAPPFPHAWVGRFNDPAQRAIVSGADSTWVVAVGDVIDGQWRIDQIQERQMKLTYLPLQQHQTVAMKAP